MSHRLLAAVTAAVSLGGVAAPASAATPLPGRTDIAAARSAWTTVTLSEGVTIDPDRFRETFPRFVFGPHGGWAAVALRAVDEGPEGRPLLYSSSYDGATATSSSIGIPAGDYQLATVASDGPPPAVTLEFPSRPESSGTVRPEIPVELHRRNLAVVPSATVPNTLIGGFSLGAPGGAIGFAHIDVDRAGDGPHRTETCFVDDPARSESPHAYDVGCNANRSSAFNPPGGNVSSGRSREGYFVDYEVYARVGGFGLNVTDAGPSSTLSGVDASLHFADLVTPDAPAPPPPTATPVVNAPAVRVTCPTAPLRLTREAHRAARRLAARAGSGRVRSIRPAGADVGRRCGNRARARTLVVRTSRASLYVSRFRGRGYRVWLSLPR